MINLCEELKLQIRLPNKGIFVLDDPENGRLDIEKLGGTAIDEQLFILDKSRLDDQYLAAPGDEPDSPWTDVIEFAQSIRIRRGARETETGSQTEAGVFTVTLVGPQLDPHKNASIANGAKMRLTTTDGTPVFTGVIRRVITHYEPDGLIRVTITVLDGVHQLANIMRYGADDASFPERIDSLLAKHGIIYNKQGGDAELAQTDYEGNLVRHLQMAVDSEQGWWFVGRDDSVQIGGNQTDYDPFIRTELRRNLVKNAGMRLDTQGFRASLGKGQSVAEWAKGPVDRGVFRVSFHDTDRIIYFAFTAGETDHIPVTPGQAYTFSAYLNTNRTELALKSFVTWHNAAGNFISATASSAPVYSTGLGNFVRTSITAIPPAGAVGAVYSFGPFEDYVNYWQPGDVLEAADVLAEKGTTLGSFFDGGMPDQGSIHYEYDGVALYSQSVQLSVVPKEPEVPDEAVLTFAAREMDIDNIYYYTAVDYSSDSGDILNELETQNRRWDAVENKGVTDTHTFVDETSRAANGASAATLETNLVNEADIDLLAQRVLVANRTPENVVKSLTFNANEAIAMAAGLDPYRVIQVHYENDYFEETDLYVILGIEHDINRDRWLTTLTLTKYKGGI